MSHHGHLVFYNTVLFPGDEKFPNPYQRMNDKQEKHYEYGEKDGNGIAMPGVG